MKPGRELDALVAEKVMGWAIAYGRDSKYGDYVGNMNAPDRTRNRDLVPHYSTELEDAWFVVEEMNCRGFNVCTASRSDGKSACYLTREDSDKGSAPWRDSIPYAICLSALAAVGVEVPE